MSWPQTKSFCMIPVSPAANFGHTPFATEPRFPYLRLRLPKVGLDFRSGTDHVLKSSPKRTRVVMTKASIPRASCASPAPQQIVSDCFFTCDCQLYLTRTTHEKDFGPIARRCRHDPCTLSFPLRGRNLTYSGAFVGRMRTTLPVTDDLDRRAGSWELNILLQSAQVYLF